MGFEIAITATLVLALIIQCVLNSKELKNAEMKMRGERYERK